MLLSKFDGLFYQLQDGIFSHSFHQLFRLRLNFMKRPIDICVAECRLSVAPQWTLSCYMYTPTLGLLFKLSNLGFSNTTLQWMSSFLMDRQQRVRVNGCLSTSKSPKSGIPQGTVLGPVLFLVYINDLPCSISSDCSIFADDTSVYNTGSKPPSTCSMLSKDLNYAADWAAEWGMLFNAEKSEHLAISTRKSDITSPHVTMNGTQIPQVTSHKHLGVNFNNTLSWQQHVDKVYTSCARRIGMIPAAITTKASPGCSEAKLLGSSTAKIGVRMPSVVWWTNTES